MERSVLLPESYRFYMQLQNRNALDRLVEQKTPPPSLNWNELKNFYHAQFSFQVTQYAYYLFLREAWEKTWGDALSQAEGLTPFSNQGDYDSYNSDYGEKVLLAPADVWDDSLYQLYRRRNREIWWFGIATVFGPDALRLYWYCHDNAGEDVSRKISLVSRYWEAESGEDNCRETPIPLCLLNTDMHTVPLDELYQAAVHVINTL